LFFKGPDGGGSGGGCGGGHGFSPIIIPTQPEFFQFFLYFFKGPDGGGGGFFFNYNTYSTLFELF
jgi:hypothetical protein